MRLKLNSISLILYKAHPCLSLRWLKDIENSVYVGKVSTNFAINMTVSTQGAG